MLEYKIWKLLQQQKKIGFLQVTFNIDDMLGSVLQNKGIIITLNFVYLVNKLIWPK